jgi:hypothetical protein
MYGKKANHVRYIKQVTDDKGWILKTSKVVRRPKARMVSYWDTFNWTRLFYLVGIVIGIYLLLQYKIQIKWLLEFK